MTEKALQNQVKIGLIATGDELTQGDILNTNGQHIAEALHELGFLVNQHIIVNDNESNICDAVIFQAKRHGIVILTGGLGPTSDDRTRFALAKALKKELLFDEATWQSIKARLKSVNLAADQHNQQQALFPENSIILPNSNGTAAGCYIEQENVTYFMLPGPPHECLPIFQQQILPLLKPKARPHHHFKWLLMGASEGDIAAKLDAALAAINCCTGYRWAYPYLEFKVYADNQASLAQAEQNALSIVAPYLVSKHGIDFQQQLLTTLANSNHKLYFSPTILSQYVQAALISNQTMNNIAQSETEQCINVTITGLDEYWQQKKPPLETLANLKLTFQKQIIEESIPLYYRDQRILHYLVATVCKSLIFFVNNI